MTKQKKPDPIPEEFSSYEEAGKFWDSHDTTDYPTAFRTVSAGRKRKPLSSYWKNTSVLEFASGEDPIVAMTQRAQATVFKALEEGWHGPPFDPQQLAKILGIRVVPSSGVGGSVDDARTVPDKNGKFTIEYNPDKPPARVRFSICHEIAHTFFKDCSDRVRNRLAHHEIHGNERQLEMLCNLGAAELLMPIGSFPDVVVQSAGIDDVLALRKKYEVSTEAALLRTVRLSREPLAAFSAIAVERNGVIRYVLEYCIGSIGWNSRLQSGTALPETTALKQCIALGFTSKSTEVWDTRTGEMLVEAVGIPSYGGGMPAMKPSDFYKAPTKMSAISAPRVVGLIRPAAGQGVERNEIQYLKRDATIPINEAPTVVAHVVNDKTPNWGGGFGLAVRKKWPEVQEAFRSNWFSGGGLKLGSSAVTEVSPSVSVFHMVAQHGYGPSPKPRVRYESLNSCLEALTEVAQEKQAKIQMPRIGSGEAGGSWPVIAEMIESVLCKRGLAVTVCELPGVESQQKSQMDLLEQVSSSRPI